MAGVRGQPNLLLRGGSTTRTSPEPEVDPTVSIEDSWAVIHEWIGRNHPSMLSLLNGPAKAAEFKRLERRLGQTLPDDFKASYRVHDGSERTSGVLVGLSLMSLAVVGRTWEGWAKIADDEDTVEDLSEDCQS